MLHNCALLLKRLIPMLCEHKMRCNTPAFWAKKNSALAMALKPLSYLYAVISHYRYRAVTPAKMDKPVICIGNITAGGAGKTPVAIAICQILQQQGVVTAFLSRGYGGKHTGPHRVDREKDNAQEVGDEPLLLSRYAPTWVAKQRVLGAKAAIKAGAGVIIMDDGFQNPSVKKDLSFLVIDGSFGVGNGCIIPSGPLRETLDEALKRCDAVIVIGQDKTHITARIPASIPVIFASMEPYTVPNIAGKKCVAFAGIGNPEKFFATLSSIGADLVMAHKFPDHYMYSEQDIASLLQDASKHSAQLVTTEKDWVRLPRMAKEQVVFLPVSIRWEDEGKIYKIVCEGDICVNQVL